MKIAILGGGGVRTPLFVDGLLRRLDRIPIEELWLQDTDPRRLAGIGLVVDGLVSRAGRPFRVMRTEDAAAAIAGSDFVLATVRVGCEDGRVLDERVPLSYGVLGQETTGPGGMSMALRTIPVMLGYAEQIRQLAPEAWLINFTNPVGIITQALTAAGIKVVGICDSATALCRGVAKSIGAPTGELEFAYGGLNHLGWLTGLRRDGRDIFADAIDRLAANPETRSVFGFPPELIAAFRLVPNEYLYYFYYAREAVEHILASGRTRGEQVRELNQALYAALADFGPGDQEAAAAVYRRYMDNRVATYMQTETAGTKVEEAPDPGEMGYEGMAMGIMQAIHGGVPQTLIVDTVNGAALPDLGRDDVVEIPCRIGREGIRPIAQGPLPEAVRGLVQQVKAYERLVVEAAVAGDRAKALQALAIHPLVPSFDLAGRILDDYLEAHRGYLTRFA